MTVDLVELQAFADTRPLLHGWDVARAFSDLAPDEAGEFYQYDEARARMMAAVEELAQTQGEFTNLDIQYTAGVGRSTASVWGRRFVAEGLLEIVTKRVGKDATKYRMKERTNGN